MSTNTNTNPTNASAPKKDTFKKVFSIIKLVAVILFIITTLVVFISTGKIRDSFQSTEQRHADSRASAEADFIAKKNENERNFITSILGEDTDVVTVEDAMAQKQENMMAQHTLLTRKFQLAADIARVENEIIFATYSEQPEMLEELQAKLETLKNELADIEAQLAQ